MEEGFKLLAMVPPWPPHPDGLHGDCPGYYRILTQGSTVKYLQYSHAWDAPSARMGDHRGTFLSFSTVPAGDWNLGKLSRRESDGKFILGPMEKATIPGGVDRSLAFHPKKVELESLLERELVILGPGGDSILYDDVQRRSKVEARLCSGQDLFGVDKVVAVWDWNPNECIQPAGETKMYRMIHGQAPDIAPRFLGHITENGGRIIGYVVEYVENKRIPTIDDLAICQSVLSKLHGLGILHRSLERSDIFVVGEGDEKRAMLHDFGSAQLEHDEAKLAAEMATLPAVLYGIVHEFWPASTAHRAASWPEPPDFFPRHLSSGVVVIPE